MLSNYNVPNPLLPAWGVPANAGRNIANRNLASINLATMMNRLFQDFETAIQRPTARRAAGPRVQMRDLGEAMSLMVELPGCQLADVDLGIEGDVLTLEVAPPKSDAPEGF